MKNEDIAKEMSIQIQQVRKHTPELTDEELNEILDLVINESEDIPKDEKEELKEMILKLINVG